MIIDFKFRKFVFVLMLIKFHFDEYHFKSSKLTISPACILWADPPLDFAVPCFVIHANVQVDDSSDLGKYLAVHDCE